MKIALIIWLVGGVLLNIFGEWADDIRKDIKKNWDHSSDGTIEDNSQNKKWKLVAFVAFLRLLLVIFFPAALVILIIDHFRGVDKKKRNEKEIAEQIKKEKEEIKKAVIENRSFIYLKNFHGGGVITCHGCGHSEEIVGYIHGFDDPCPYRLGYQCQSCGKFHYVDFLGDKRVSSDKCSCGGKLSNDEPAFCPRCKTRDVTYQRTYMT